MTTLEDELTSINSIYSETTLELILNTAPPICILRPPSLPSVSLRVEFPPDYPDAPPSILGTQTIGDELPKGFGTHVADIFRTVLSTVYRPGEPCIFDLLEDAAEPLAAALEATLPPAEGVDASASSAPHDDTRREGSNARAAPTLASQMAERAPAAAAPPLIASPPPPWTTADALVEKKSVFVGRAARATSPAVARSYVAHLLASDRHVARATHNITAWRIRDANNPSVTYQDCDDDGETAAGGRVLHLMQVMDVWDVMVVVSRWYGGVLLGPDRFRCINQVAREALVKGGFVREDKEGGGKKGKAKKGG
jgi:hypothetical protein